MLGNDGASHTRPKPSENLKKIDIELIRCRQRLDDLKLIRSLEAREKM
jgi:hypothetical protein